MKYYYYKLLYKRKYILFLDTLIRIIKNKLNNKYCTICKKIVQY